MNFGLALPYNNTRLVAKLAQSAEEAGWDGLFLGDAIWCEDPMVALAAAAMTTHRIRLGITVIPVPLRKPWKLASESLALDHLSDGRLILGLGAGAVWMGWQYFPDEVTDTKTRAELLDETIDILSLLYQRKQFDYEGKHYHLKLTQMDLMHFPPKPIQQPRVPLWIPGIWPRMKSMQRVLKCDGLLVEKRNQDNQPEDATPNDIRDMKAYIKAHRTLTTPFDIVMTGNTANLEPAQRQEILLAWQEAGVTWWIEGFLGESEERVAECIQKGPPRM